LGVGVQLPYSDLLDPLSLMELRGSDKNPEEEPLRQSTDRRHQLSSLSLPRIEIRLGGKVAGAVQGFLASE